MNIPRLIWGVICLAVAVLLAVLHFVLPPGDLTFMIGEANVPWVLPIVLGIVGIVLLATSKGGRSSAIAGQGAEGEPAYDPEKATLNQRMEAIAWGCFLMMAGGFMFVSDTLVTTGVWSVGVGLIMLGLNAARYLNQIRMSGFSVLMGIVFLFGGILQMLSVQGIEGVLLVIVLGAYLIFKSWFDKRQLFGKAEESHV